MTGIIGAGAIGVGEAIGAGAIGAAAIGAGAIRVGEAIGAGAIRAAAMGARRAIGTVGAGVFPSPTQRAAWRLFVSE